MKKRLLVLSFDALGGADFEYLKVKPEFKAFFDQAAICTNVRTVYPSVTYPCHVSIVTGIHPKDHGVTANTLVQPERINAPDWYWQDKYVKSETIYDAAIRSGMKVAAFLWPVTAKSKIHYLLPEIFPNRKWDHQVWTALRHGSPLFLLGLFRRYRHHLDGIKQPNLDQFVVEGVCHTIKTKSPELMLVHLTDLDTAKHDHGVHSDEAFAAMDRLATHFARIVDALKEKGLFDETTIAILGDHSQLDFHTKVPLNHLLAESGWLTFRKDKVTSWKVLVKSNGGSAYVYTKDDDVDRVNLKDFLEKLQADGRYGIERILTGEEAGAQGADPNCAFMLEAKIGYGFSDWLGAEEKGKKADHGYHPSKPDYETFFAMAGPGIKKGAQIKAMSLVDIAPTWAELLNLELKDVDGVVLDIFT